MKSTLWILDW